MKSAVFLDIDNTIWSWEHVIPDSVYAALSDLRKNGHPVFFNSGRSRAHIEDDTLLSLPIDGIIAACGNYIEIGGELCYEHTMSKEELARVFRIAKEERMPFILEGSAHLFMNPEDFAGDAYVERLWNNLGERAKRLEALTDEDPINKFSVAIPEHTDFERVKRELADILEPLDHGVRVCEFIPKGSGKAKGIAYICAHMGIARQDTYAIGDSVNDLDMFDYAGHGICMGNGSAIAKERAEYVTKTLEEDGIMHALKHYGLI